MASLSICLLLIVDTPLTHINDLRVIPHPHPPCLFFYFQSFALLKLNVPPSPSISHGLSTQLCQQMVCKDWESWAHASSCARLSTSSRQRLALKMRFRDSIYSCAYFFLSLH